MGKRRIRLLKELSSDFLIVGVDSNCERVENVSRQYEINCFSSLAEVNLDLECAFVCTSPQSHGRIIQECLNRDCHVFSEINLIDELYTENIQLAKEKGKILFLSSTPMYREEMQYINRKVKQNGKPCIYQYHVGQYLPDWHPWDNLQDFFVSSKRTNGCREYLAIEIPWIQKTFGEIVHVQVIKRKMTDLGLDFSDTYIIQAEHESGTVGSLVIDVVSRQATHHLEVFNKQLYIKWDGTPDSLREKDLVTGELKAVGTGSYMHVNGYADFINEVAYLEEIKDFFGALGGNTPLYSFEEDQRTLKVIEEIER